MKTPTRPRVKIRTPEQADSTATTLAFDHVLEGYPELPYFIHIGQVNARHGWGFIEHTHASDHELIVLQEGRIRAWIDGQDFIRNPGDCYFLLPGQRHREESLTARLKFTFMNFSLWTAAGPDGRLAPRRESTTWQHFRDADGTVAHAMTQIMREVRQEREGAFEIVNGAILQLIWHIRRKLRIIRPQLPLTEVTGQQRRIVHQARLYLQQHLAQPVTLSALSRHCNLSPDYLWHLFKKLEGKTPLQYAQGLRMAEAARLLRQTDLTSYQIADKLGFRDAGYFSRTFTRCTGFTPTSYRRRRGTALPLEQPQQPTSSN